ncbi:MAG: hypothetical protein ACOY33_02330 [Pseudomonadota bacterium]
MTDQKSYTRIESEVVPAYRRNVAAAESAEDVRKCFARTVCELLVKASDERVRVRHEDVTLQPGAAAPHYALSDELTGQAAYRALAKDSDLGAILARLAEPAIHRHTHLAKHQEKTNTNNYIHH